MWEAECPGEYTIQIVSLWTLSGHWGDSICVSIWSWNHGTIATAHYSYIQQVNLLLYMIFIIRKAGPFYEMLMKSLNLDPLAVSDYTQSMFKDLVNKEMLDLIKQIDPIR